MSRALLGARAVIWLTAMLLCEQAAAHGDMPYAREIFLDAGELVGGAVSYGLLLFQDGDGVWTTEETIGSEPRWYHRLSDGSVIAAGFTGLFVTRDGGCSWEQLPDLQEYAVSTLVVDPTDPTTLVVVTTSRDVDNGVFISRNSGESWSQVGASFPGISLKSIVVTSGAEEMWVQGKRQDEWLPVAFRFFGDEGWKPIGFDLEGYREFTLFSVADDAPLITVGAQSATGRAMLLASRDGLDSVEEVGELGARVITDYAEVEGHRFVTTRAFGNVTALWRSRAGGPFEVVDGPGLCVLGGQGGTVWGCGDIETGGHFLRSDDGESWKVIEPFGGACARSCSAQSSGEELNRAAAEELRGFGVGTECFDTGESSTAGERSVTGRRSGGGCHGLPGAAASWSGLLGFTCLAFVRRKVRRAVRR